MRKVLIILFEILTIAFVILIYSTTWYEDCPHPTNLTLSRVDSLIDQKCLVRELLLTETYDGPAVATLLSSPADSNQGRAVLYVHGYGDYFFQDHLLTWYNSRGYNFYALELRRYGRSWLPNQEPNYMKDVSEYFEEIDRAVGLIRQDGNEELILNGHSTGGLITSLYCARGGRREAIDALVLNSPFLDFNSSALEEAAISVFSLLSWFNPDGCVPRKREESLYTKSLHRDYYGRWDFNTEWKPLKSFPLYLNWLKGIRRAHAEVTRGLSISCPVLVLHSDRSYCGDEFSEEMLRTDAVLDVEDIKSRAPLLGHEVTVVSVPGAVHDVFLSRPEVVNRAFMSMEQWLSAQTGRL